jgi:hypothetical protein
LVNFPEGDDHEEGRFIMEVHMRKLLSLTAFLALLVPGSPVFADANFDTASSILTLDSVNLGGTKYGNLRIRINQLGAVTTLSSYMIGGNSYDAATQTLTLPYITVGTSSHQNIAVVLANISVLSALPDETASAAALVAAYAQGTYTLNCTYFDPLLFGNASGSQTVTISSSGAVSGSGLSTFSSQPSDSDYKFNLSDSSSYGISLYNPKVSLRFSADGSLVSTANSN